MILGEDKYNSMDEAAHALNGNKLCLQELTMLQKEETINLAERSMRE